jgi:periplasmic protein TonB
MKFIFLPLFLFLSTILFAQKKSSSLPDTSQFQRVDKIDKDPSVDAEKWINHLAKSLQRDINKAAKKGLKPGTYTVNVRFLVEKDGSISYAEALNDIGFGLAEAAVRTLKTGPKWMAGELNGQKIRSFHTQPITFVVPSK